MRMSKKTKSGQVTLLMVFLLAGLVLLFLLNVDLFKAARTKLRLQNVADASAMAVARWQGMTLNLVGDLNFAHLKVISDIAPADENTTNFIAGITALQRHLKAIGPLIGFDTANQIARHNGAKPSSGMKEATELIANSTDSGYAGMIRRISASGVYAGIDNVKSPTDILTKPAFYKAVLNENFQALCAMGGYHHTLPPAGILVPSAEDMFNRGCVGHVGVQEHSYTNQSNNIDFIIDSLVDLSHLQGYRNSKINVDNLKTNAAVILSAENALKWNTFAADEWRDMPAALQKGNFPWIDNLDMNSAYAIMGGSCAIRVEDAYVVTNSVVTTDGNSNWDMYSGDKINPVSRFGNGDIVHKATTNIIVAQSAAKIMGKLGNGSVVTKQRLYPPLIVPVFSSVRYVPFALGANGRESMADAEHVCSFPRCTGDNSEYQRILDKYHSVDFRNKAAVWFANHDCDKVCCPPRKPGSGSGGGTDRVP